LKNGSVQKVFIPNNCPAAFVKELEYYNKISKVEIERFKGTASALGQICGKPFRIVMLGIGK
ncbi:MAG: ribosomal L7Ae/L30e/S12e/Gadd45 family protein, partial [Candidatus Aenigmatarchaeota archaeon]